MKFRHILFAAVVAGGTLALFAFAPWKLDPQQAKEKTGTPSGSAAMPFTQAEMEAMQKSATPGPQHAELQRLAGTWTVQAKSWMKPGLPPEEWTATAECKPALGGRYLVEDFSGTMSMGPYHGHGMLGFNNTTKEWEQVWLDDMSTGMMVSHGVMQDGAVALESTFTCPMNGEPVHSRIVMKSLSDDERTVEMWTTMSGQPEFQSMSLHYKRTGATSKGDRR
jgi:hypothetical protein